MPEVFIQCKNEVMWEVVKMQHKCDRCDREWECVGKYEYNGIVEATIMCGVCYPSKADKFFKRESVCNICHPRY